MDSRLRAMKKKEKEMRKVLMREAMNYTHYNNDSILKAIESKLSVIHREIEELESKAS